jgi:two-component sensor histidine kinase
MSCLCAKDMLAPDIVLVNAESRIRDVINDVRRMRASYAVVFDSGRFAGVVPLQIAFIRNPSRIFADLLDVEPCPVAPASAPIHEVERIFTATGAECISVEDEHKACAGIVTRSSLLRAMMDETLGRINQTTDRQGASATGGGNGIDEAERAALLKEIHHRVKNNLQLISSLLSLQLRRIGDPDAAGSFQVCIDRIHAMSVVHEHLYREKLFSRIDFSGCVRMLAEKLLHKYRKNNISAVMEIESVHLGIDQAIPCGLIVNELLTNCLKHAFPDRDRGVIRVDAFMDEDATRCHIAVCDNGAGVPSDFNFKNPTHSGFLIVNSLVGQLNGELTLNVESGTEFRLVFPVVRDRRLPECSGIAYPAPTRAG